MEHPYTKLQGADGHCLPGWKGGRGIADIPCGAGVGIGGVIHAVRNRGLLHLPLDECASHRLMTYMASPRSPDRSFRVDKGRSVLEGHGRKKKKIVSPYAALPLTQTSFTADIFPELLWLALILERYGYRRGIEIATLFQAALYKADESRPWHRTSEIAEIGTQLWSALEDVDGVFKAEVEDALQPLVSLYSELEFSFVEKRNGGVPEMVGILKRCVGRFSNRFETPGCVLIGGIVFLQAFVGRMKVPRETLGGINSIVGKPGSEEAELASSIVRATLLAMWSADDPHPSEWPKAFWRANRLVSRCEIKSRDA